MKITGKIIDVENPLQPQVRYVEVLINGSTYIDKSTVNDAPNLRLIDQLGIGVDNRQSSCRIFPCEGNLSCGSSSRKFGLSCRTYNIFYAVSSQKREELPFA